MINHYVLQNLRHRWVRTLLSAIVVGIQVMLILTVIGLSKGMLEDTAQRAKGTGADIFIKPGSSISFSTGQTSEKYVAWVAKQPHVAQAVGVLMVPTSQPFLPVNGVDIPEFRRISIGFRFIQGGMPDNPDGLIVDEYYAQQHGLHPGMKVNLVNHEWTLSGVIRGGVLAHLIVDLRRLQYLTSNAGQISQTLVKLDNPALTNEMVNDLNAKLQGRMTAISTADFVSMFNVNNLPALRAFIWVMVALAILVGFLIVFLSMYTAVVERTREIGILKALGAKPGTVIGILVREAIALAIVGCVIGVLLSFGAKGLIMSLVPASLQVANVPEWWPLAAGIAIVGALLGAIIPSMKAARQDAIEALAYD